MVSDSMYTSQDGMNWVDRKSAKKNILFIAVFAASFLYILWRLFFTLPIRHGTPSIVWGLLLWIAESGTTIETFSHFYNVRNVTIPDLPVIPHEMYPHVDILICTHNESEDLLYKTLNGCNYLRYPDKSKVHIYLCDDANRPEIEALTKRMGVGYFGFDGNKHAKAGNINYAIPKTHSSLVAIFDADMIPTKDFLMETVPYFFLRDMIQKKDGSWRKRKKSDGPSKEKELGYVQTQQSFYNPDPLQRNLYMENNAPNEQDYFYRAVNVARTYSGAAAFAGSNTLFSRKALEEVGGLATYSITEDLATSIPILSAGYSSIAVAKELAHGLSPEDAYSFIKQRKRWSRGSAQVIPTMRFLRSKLSLRAKWSFIVSYFYWWTFVRRLIFILCPILYGLFNIAAADVSFLQLIVIWLPHYLIYNTGLRLMSGNTINALWSSVIDTVQFPYLIIPIIVGTMKIPERKFWVTPKEKIKGRNSSIRLAMPQIVLTILSLVSGAVCLYNLFVLHYDGAIIVLFWLCYNLFTLLIAIVYYSGRINNREYERIPAFVPLTLHVHSRKISNRAIYLAEDGMALRLSFPEYLPYDRSFWITVHGEEYTANMKVRVDHVQKVRKGWRYSLVITEIEDADKREYMQILYDRPHSFARTSNVSMTILISNIVRGIRSKRRNARLIKRQLPDIATSFVLQSQEAGEVNVVGFDYANMLVQGGKNLPKTLTVAFGEKVKMIGHKVNVRHHNAVRYKIDNWKELAENPDLRQFLMQMLAEEG